MSTVKSTKRAAICHSVFATYDTTIRATQRRTLFAADVATN